MRLLFVQNMAGVSGSETHFLEILPALRERGVACEFACVQRPAVRAKNTAFCARLRAAGVPVHELARGPALDPVMLTRLAALVRRGGYDVVHSHLVHADAWCALVKAAARRRFVLFSTKHGYNDRYQAAHGFDPRFVRRDAFYLAQRWSNRRADHIIAISAGLRDLAVGARLAPAAKVTVVPYGFDYSGVCYHDRGPYRFGDRQLLVLGRLVAVKGHRFALAALARLVAAFPDIVLVFVGAGPLEAALQREVAARGLARHVRFEGFRPDAHDYLRASDVVLVPSTAEGLGAVVLEAWHHGKPVVAFDVPALNELVADGRDGYLVPPFDTAVLADRIDALLRDAALRARMGAAGRVKVARDYSVARMVDATLALYARFVPAAVAAATAAAPEDL
jgi:glycosyltransferase involved in cell wall biosynthesis